MERGLIQGLHLPDRATLTHTGLLHEGPGTGGLGCGGEPGEAEAGPGQPGVGGEKGVPWS